MYYVWNHNHEIRPTALRQLNQNKEIINLKYYLNLYAHIQMQYLPNSASNTSQAAWDKAVLGVVQWCILKHCFKVHIATLHTRAVTPSPFSENIMQHWAQNLTQSFYRKSKFCWLQPQRKSIIIDIYSWTYLNADIHPKITFST